MPKFREPHDPIDDPSLRDLMDGKDLADQAMERIHEVEELCNPFPSDDYGSHILDPEQLLIVLSEVEISLESLPKIEQEKIRQSIERARTRAIEVYPSFLTHLIEQYGFARSRGREPRIEKTSILEAFEKAKDGAKVILSYRRDDYLANVLEQEQRLHLFSKEARYYLFEREAEQLESELLEAAFPGDGFGWDPGKALPDAGEAQDELEEKGKSFEETIRRLRDLSKELHDPMVKGVAEDTLRRLESLLKGFERRTDEPGQYRAGQTEQTVTNLPEAYRLLGFTPGDQPSKQDVTKRYVVLAMENHPDRVGEEGTRRMATINGAIAMIRKTWEQTS
jgi:DnaJ-domain-containing protein 1